MSNAASRVGLLPPPSGTPVAARSSLCRACELDGRLFDVPAGSSAGMPVQNWMARRAPDTPQAMLRDRLENHGNSRSDSVR